MTVSERVAYLKGLSKGLDFESESKEGKLIMVIIDILDEIAKELENLEENSRALGDEMDELSDDLAAVEDIVYEDMDDECQCGCNDGYYEVKCPTCGTDIEVDNEAFESMKLECPNCGEKIEIELDEEEDN